MKKRKSLTGKSDVLTQEERERLLKTHERLRKEAERLPVNEGELRRAGGDEPSSRRRMGRLRLFGTFSAKDALVQSIIDNDTVIVSGFFRCS